LALEMKTSCERCSVPIELAAPAWICSFECTFCTTCAGELAFTCKNCGGELVQRPRRGRLSRRPVGAVHRAQVSWCRGDAVFIDRRYSRVHQWSFENGPEVRASSSPHVVPAPLSDPSAVDPEAAFIAALSSCHMLWFLDLASRAGLIVERYEDHAEGLLVSKTVSAPEATSSGSSSGEAASLISPSGEASAPAREVGRSSVEPFPVLEQITLRPVVTFATATPVPADVLERLHHEAHERCFLASALKIAPQLSAPP
jgi:organic hydroperoxide reductase OsmC/OhrA